MRHIHKESQIYDIVHTLFPHKMTNSSVTKIKYKNNDFLSEHFIKEAQGHTVNNLTIKQN